MKNISFVKKIKFEKNRCLPNHCCLLNIFVESESKKGRVNARETEIERESPAEERGRREGRRGLVREKVTEKTIGPGGRGGWFAEGRRGRE